MEMDLDRISNLPSEVTGQILSRLKIKEAVRTSLLKWRYKWAMLSDLVFDDDLVVDVKGYKLTRTLRAARIIDHILLTHIGPIHKFELSDNSGEFSDIDRWIPHLSRNSTMKEFKLRAVGFTKYKMPTCFFSWPDLIQLDLGQCTLKPPSTFKGFRSLKILRFVDVYMAQAVFENMIGYSPLLEKLDLESCNSLSQVKIDAPNLLNLRIQNYFESQVKIDAPKLQNLHLQGSLEDVTIVNTFNLIDVDINIVPKGTSVLCSSTRLLNFYAHMPHIQRLKIDSVKYFAYGVVPEKLPGPLLDLKYLKIAFCIVDLKEVLTASSLPSEKLSFS